MSMVHMVLSLCTKNEDVDKPKKPRKRRLRASCALEMLPITFRPCCWWLASPGEVTTTRGLRRCLSRIQAAVIVVCG